MTELLVSKFTVTDQFYTPALAINTAAGNLKAPG